MDVVTLSRIQFAVATLFHFLFVPLTLGLSVIVAIMESLWVKTGNDVYRRMARFWGKLFLINFSVGVVTGLTLEFQFGTNWSRYSAYVGDIFGSLLAVEATVAFFLESTFIAVWFFGWKKLSRGQHLAAIWIVAIASSISAFWIIAANAFMQHPVGFEIRNGRAELTDFFAVITQKFAIYEFVHTLSGAYLLASFFVLGISSWHLLKAHNEDFFRKSFKVAAVFSLVSAVFVTGFGHVNAAILHETQPAKLAAMEAHWETSRHVPMYLLSWPDEKHERNFIQTLGVPGLISILATDRADGEVKGLKDWPADERPPVLVSFLAFRGMVGLGTLFFLIAGWAVVMRNRPEDHRWLLKLCVLAIPLPYLANELGWILAEMGRQPWIVYGIMKTRDAVSPISPLNVWISLVAFILLYGLLGLLDFVLLFQFAKRGPDITGALKISTRKGF